MFVKSKARRDIKHNFWRKLMRGAEEFCLETSIHGFNHIVVPRRHWAERLLWVGILCVAVWGMAEVSLGQLQRYQENSTVVTLEKDFRTWNYSLPAVTACAGDRVDPKKLEQAIKARWNVSPGEEQYTYYQRFVDIVANSDLFHLERYQELPDDDSLDVDLKKLVLDVMVDHQVKTSSSLNLIARWMPVMTEAGVCHVINSLAIADVALSKFKTNDTLPYTCKYSAMSCYIMFEIFKAVDFYIHSPYDIMDITTTPSRAYITLNRFTDLRVLETRAGVGVRALQPKRRRCFYTDEPTDTRRQVYSTNTCRSACRSRLAKELCGCVPFYYFYDGGVACRLAGMKCLAKHSARLSAGVRCACGQQCVDALFRELANDDQIWGRGLFQNKASVRFTVQAPRARYTREIVFHFQDLVVSFGGAAGLFLGASFISFVEILYFILQHCFKLFIKDQTEVPTVTVKKYKTPFETTRIREITSILERNKIVEYQSFRRLWPCVLYCSGTERCCHHSIATITTAATTAVPSITPFTSTSISVKVQIC
ncbi:pickpocket protein 19-like [Epargyreus clarus]|uniref:pickpocket protein 19-like n=1 Tax=Epargyreus clarus TaxID=520877 RepID=UPI003C2E0D59